MSQAIRVGVYGASGYAGLDLVEILSHHPDVDLIFATSNTHAGDFVPSTDLRYIPTDSVDFSSVDMVFLAVHHRTAAPLARRALDAGIKVIDLSADFRLETAEAYQTWYGIAHPHPELLPVPYGLPEMNRDNLRGTKLLAVPGCYPTTTLLGLYPLLRVSGLALDTPLIVDAKSGVSGAGRAPKDNTHFVEVYGNLTPYSVGRKHRHVGEIEQMLQKYDNYGDSLIFTPHLLPVARGMMASIYVTLNYNMTSDRVHSLYTNVYADEPMVTVLPLGREATLKDAVLRNICAISISPVTERHLLITSVTDNLRKGAASQAVQCFNLMFDLSETTGLL
jgi:N-acetyl-gamma-glutamyl-phosphate reductase